MLCCVELMICGWNHWQRNYLICCMRKNYLSAQMKKKIIKKVFGSGNYLKIVFKRKNNKKKGGKRQKTWKKAFFVLMGTPLPPPFLCCIFWGQFSTNAARATPKNPCFHLWWLMPPQGWFGGCGGYTPKSDVFDTFSREFVEEFINIFFIFIFLFYFFYFFFYFI